MHTTTYSPPRYAWYLRPFWHSNVRLCILCRIRLSVTSYLGDACQQRELVKYDSLRKSSHSYTYFSMLELRDVRSDPSLVNISIRGAFSSRYHSTYEPSYVESASAAGSSYSRYSQSVQPRSLSSIGYLLVPRWEGQLRHCQPLRRLFRID
jgi:hypothetical protein